MVAVRADDEPDDDEQTNDPDRTHQRVESDQFQQLAPVRSGVGLYEGHPNRNGSDNQRCHAKGESFRSWLLATEQYLITLDLFRVHS